MFTLYATPTKLFPRQFYSTPKNISPHILFDPKYSSACTLIFFIVHCTMLGKIAVDISTANSNDISNHQAQQDMSSEIMSCLGIN